MSDPELPHRHRCASRGLHLDGCPCREPGHEHGRTIPVDPADLADWERELTAGQPVLEQCPRCDGCLPRQAAHGSRTCTVCENRGRRALDTLPGLWVDLAVRPNLGGAPLGDQAGIPLGDRSIAARRAIRATLTRYTTILRDEHHITPPSDDEIIGTTRTLALEHSRLAREWRDDATRLDQEATRAELHSTLAADTLTLPNGDHSTPVDDATQRDLAWQARDKRREADDARRYAAQKHHDAEQSRDDRATGLDIIRAHAQHIARHLGTLLAGVHARDTLTHLLAAQTGARAVANPSRDTRQRIACPCGAWVPLDPDDTMECPGCGETGVLAWWVTHHAATPAAEWMTTTELVGWLLLQGIDLGPPDRAEDRLRKWASLHPEEMPRKPRTPDDNPRDRRARYSSAGTLALARRKTRTTLPGPRPATDATTAAGA